MQKKLQAVKGMNDLLPEQSALWEHLEHVVSTIFRQYGYRNMRAPVVESTPLFVQSIGEVTDIVETEMYTFIDSLNGDSLTLRPEATAGLVRAAVEHSITYNAPQRIWMVGPMFRHERPQKGRYRQFHQFDVECFGFAGPDVDAEIIIMCQRIWNMLGIAPQVRLEINTIGDAVERKAHREALIAYFEKNSELLDEEAKRRLHTNPLRILDTKNPKMQAMVDAAPKLIDMLGEASQSHFDQFQSLLKSAGLRYTINPRLVRGMDYYNRSVFEFVAAVGDTNLTICGGGRYDGLFEELGGKSTPAIGFGMGVERVLLVLQQLNIEMAHRCDAYVVHDDFAAANALAETLRDAGKMVVVHASGGKFGNQMKRADTCGADFAVILGADEIAGGMVSIKKLSDGTQTTIPRAELVAYFSARH
jgi:histidyl-tRNA synthetase